MRKEAFLSTSVFALFTAVVLVISCGAWARPVGSQEAEKATKGWLKHNPYPMEKAIGRFSDAQAYADEDGEVLYYVVSLSPEGFAVLSADDAIEPVIAFASSGYFVDDDNNALKTMLENDMRGRKLAMQEDKEAIKALKKESEEKWNKLLKAGDEPDASIMGIGSVSLIYVDPFVQTLWNQGDVGGSPCYNYYTPNHYPTGCVATAMAQLMRRYSHPMAAIGVHSFTISVNGTPTAASTRGGNGSGGAYNWGQMPLNPQLAVTETERAMIGALCYDAGVAMEMAYASGGSSASLVDADQALVTTFLYGGSVYTQSVSMSGNAPLWKILNANLDAQMPVILGIHRTSGGHAVVADGYGYNGGTLYHHINLGWGGTDNAWYQLPTIDASYIYTVIDDAVYNVYTSGSGEIISGRVTNLAGAPLSGVTVRAYYGASFVKQVTTNSRGVYALTGLTGSRTYRISPLKSGETFMDQNVSVGSSADWGAPGNRNGILFVSAAFGPPVAYDVQAQTDSTAPVTVQLSALDDGEPDPNAMQYIITSLPMHGTLYEPNVGPIDSVPYAMLASDANGVTYTPCPYFGGADSFTYKANDGGTYPTGGDSNIARVTVTVNNQLNAEFGVNSNTYQYGMMMDTEFFYDARSQVIYLPSEIGGAKRLTDLSLRIGRVPTRTLTNWTIRMQHTNKTYFNSSAYEMVTSGWTTVYQANVTITSNGWYNFHFTTPFDYNGTQNLMVDFSFNNSGVTLNSYGGYFIQTVAQNRIYSLGSDTGTQGDPLTWSDWYGKYYSVDNSLPSIKLIGVPAINPIAGDFDATCSVKLPDVGIFARAWQTSMGNANYNAACDLTTSKGTINLADLIILSENWFATYP